MTLPRDYNVVYVTDRNVAIMVSPGRKSTNDFRVHYREPGKRVRTPKHIHLIIDLYMKFSKNERLTLALLDHIINDVILKLKPSNSYPPKLQIFSKEHVKQFEELNSYGEYSVEFILVVLELIMIQEKTNYPHGTMNLNLFKKFRNGADIFEVVSAATFTGR